MRWLCQPAHAVHSHQYQQLLRKSAAGALPNTVACKVMQGRQGLLDHSRGKAPKTSLHVNKSRPQQTPGQEGTGNSLVTSALLSELRVLWQNLVDSSQLACLYRARHAELGMASSGRCEVQASKRTCKEAGWGTGIG